MTAMTLHILKPSVNNMAVRVFVRAAKLDFVEDDAWGKTRSPEFLKKNPAHMTPMLEGAGLPKGALWESCAIMSYLANANNLAKFYPAEPAARAMIDSAMFYIIGTLYPLVARATYPALGFPQYPGEVGATSLDQSHKDEAQKSAKDAIAEPLEAIRQFFIGDNAFIGGSGPSIADIRLAATLEFLKAIDYQLPAWAANYMAGMEKSLGAAYSEPAADVRGFIDYVKSQKK
jgi:glutathione S-transferase